MGLSHQSIATISSPEFINLQPLDINPLMSSCEIKVLYLGKNRNGSYISKEVASEMAKSLRGAPIVGYYKQNKQDFADHGEQVIFDDEGIHFNCLTKPYGFVSPDAQVWFQDFEDVDDFNNNIVRTYLMTTGYLWTGQFAELQNVIEQGSPQSMELDEKSLKGKWSTDIKDDIEFFIINDAIFSKLCILGNDVEPCFEGSAITAPEVSTSFNLDENFKNTLFSMINDLKNALKGGNMAEFDKTTVSSEEAVQENISEEVTTTFSKEEDNNVETSFEKNDNEITEENSTDFAKEEEEEKEQEDTSDTQEDSSEKDEEDDTKKKYTALQEDYATLQEKYNRLEEENNELKNFKLTVENKQKDELIAEFYMLADDDKKDVIEHKSEYTLDEIKSKLAVICFEKKVNFNLEDSSEKEKTMTTVTFNVETKEDSTPDWVKKVESRMNGNY